MGKLPFWRSRQDLMRWMWKRVTAICWRSCSLPMSGRGFTEGILRTARAFWETGSLRQKPMRTAVFWWHPESVYMTVMPTLMVLGSGKAMAQSRIWKSQSVWCAFSMKNTGCPWWIWLWEIPMWIPMSPVPLTAGNIFRRNIPYTALQGWSAA